MAIRIRSTRDIPRKTRMHIHDVLEQGVLILHGHVLHEIVLSVRYPTSNRVTFPAIHLYALSPELEWLRSHTSRRRQSCLLVPNAKFPASP